MKKLLGIILILTMLVSLVACNSDSNNESYQDSSDDVTVENGSDTADNQDSDTAEDADSAYLENMNAFITNFETLSTEVGKMMNGYDGSEEWYTTFVAVYQSIKDSSTSLAEVVDQAPEKYKESHAKVTIAVAAYADMMDTFGTAVDAYQEGDTATGDELMQTASELYNAATQLWSEAVA